MYCSNCGKELGPDANFCASCGSPNVTRRTAQNMLEKTSVVGVATPDVASSWVRFANYILDRIFSLIFILAVFFLIGIIIGITGYDVEKISSYEWFLGIFALIVYYTLFEAIWQKTPGKFITGTKVVTRDGSKPNFSNILGRSLARFVPFDAFSFLFTPIGWHDSLSKTLVVPKAYSAADVKKIKLDRKSPTSIGLVVVFVFVLIATIGLLSTLAVVALNSAREKSRDSKRVADVKQIQTALELYYADHDEYPEATGGAILGRTSASTLCASGFRTACFGGETVYMGDVPSAPTPSDGGCLANDNSYFYHRRESTTDYTLTFCLGGSVGDLGAGFHTATSQGIR